MRTYSLWGCRAFKSRPSLFLAGGVGGLGLRASDEAIQPLHLLHRGQANRPSLRASDEHRFIVRVLRARRMVWQFPIPLDRDTPLLAMIPIT